VTLVVSIPAPRPIACPVGHAHRSRTVADDACAGRFTHAGQTVELGLEPDWLGHDFPSDDEWRIECVKFGWGLDLAHAFTETRRPRYRRTWEALVGRWIDQVPPDHDSTEVAARRVLHWLYAWQELGALDPALAARLRDSIRAQAAYVRADLTPERNHRTLELYALFAVALAFADEELLRFAVAELEENLRTDFRADGVHREGSTHYHLVALRSFLAFRENADRYGIEVAADVDERLARACDFALHCHRPDGGVPALSDADGHGYPELLDLAARLLDRSDLRWAATAGRRGTPPAERAASFPDGGYFVQRSGWGEEERPYREERFLVFDCGPLGDGGHGHYDLLSVEVAARGQPLLVDPGRFTYAEEEPNLRRWFKGTAAHNTVCVDGLDQTPYRRGKPRGPVAEGRFLGRVRAPGIDVLHGEARSPAYDAVHRRRILFVADEYWLIEDRLEAPTAHRYDLRFHLAPYSDLAFVSRDEQGVVVRAGGLLLAVLPGGAAHVEDGWVSPEYGLRLPAPVLSVAQEGRDVSFLTLVAPAPPGEPGPALRLLADGAEVTRGGVRDRVTWADGRYGLMREEP
jgi:Heparinase II/III-like protein/Heparinase II/III N-terminus